MGAKKGSTNKKNLSKKRGNKQGFGGHDEEYDDEINYHQESDEAVDDKGAMFQKRTKNPFNKSKKGGNGGMNDEIDHTESDEGNSSSNPNFNGNEFMFRKRNAKREGSKDLDIEDLEA